MTEVAAEPEATEQPAAAPAAAEPAVATPPQTPQEQADRWRPSLVAAFWTWLAGLLMYCLVTAVSWLPFGTPPALDKAYESWHRWDTTWYVIIADVGYEFDKRAAAFFPLYPMIVRGVDQVLPRGASRRPWWYPWPAATRPWS